MLEFNMVDDGQFVAIVGCHQFVITYNQATSDFEYNVYSNGEEVESGAEANFDAAQSQCEDFLENLDDREPEKFELCPQCEGSGKMVARHSQVWTESNRRDDPEGFENMLNGRYDTACDRCNGLRVVTVTSENSFRRNREDHFTYLQESGIHPGSPDWF